MVDANFGLEEIFQALLEGSLICKRHLIAIGAAGAPIDVVLHV